MVNLQIHQQFGRIGLRINPLQYELTIRLPDLQVLQKPAVITLEQPAATLNIDMTSARESLGYCSIAAQERLFNQDAMATSNAGIDRRVQEGRELGAIEKKISVGKVVSRSLEPKDKRLELVSITPIKISIQENPIIWQVQPEDVHVELTPGIVHGNLSYGSVQSYLEQKPDIQIKAVGSVIDTQR